MSDDEMPSTPDLDPVVELRARAEMLERRLANAEQEARSRMVQAELKVEALRAGIVDLDGLKLLDPSAVAIGEIRRGQERRGSHHTAQAHEALVVRWWIVLKLSEPTASATPPTKASH